jgi:hypothetical protein
VQELLVQEVDNLEQVEELLLEVALVLLLPLLEAAKVLLLELMEALDQLVQVDLVVVDE